MLTTGSVVATNSHDSQSKKFGFDRGFDELVRWIINDFTLSMVAFCSLHSTV